MPRTRSCPTSAVTARLWTIAALFLPILLPVAILYTRRAAVEAALSGGEQRWPQRLIDRPVVFYVVVWITFLAIVFGLTVVLSVFFDVPPL